MPNDDVPGSPDHSGPEGPGSPVAPPGANGPPGPAGTVGPTGPTGTYGPVGATGVQGPQGYQGPVGATGPMGPPLHDLHRSWDVEELGAEMKLFHSISGVTEVRVTYGGRGVSQAASFDGVIFLFPAAAESIKKSYPKGCTDPLDPHDLLCLSVCECISWYKKLSEPEYSAEAAFHSMRGLPVWRKVVQDVPASHDLARVMLT